MERRREFARDGQQKGSQSSPIGKGTNEEVDANQKNPNESLSDWEEEFLGKLFRLLLMIIIHVNFYSADDFSVGEEDCLDGVSKLFE